VAFGIKCYLEVYIRALYQHSSYLNKLLLHYSFSQYTEFHLDTDYDLCTINLLLIQFKMYFGIVFLAGQTLD
jgi:hypothetical protein